MWVCDSDGSNPVQLTFLDSFTGLGRWSPDGREIAFDSNAENNDDIYVVSVEGGLPRRVTTDASDDVAPKWSQDGRWIYFGSNRSGRYELWKMPPQGGKALQVTKQGGFVGFESPDGRYLYYTKAMNSLGIWKMPVEGGKETAVLQGFRLYHADWAVVDDGIYIINQLAGVIEFFSFATNRVTEITGPQKKASLGRGGLAVAPDARWVLYPQDDQTTSDIMLVENFR